MPLAPWPRCADSLVDAESDATLGWVVRVIGQIRAVRSEMNVPPGARIALIVNDASTDSKARLADHEALVKTLARVETIAFAPPVPTGSVPDVLDECSLVLTLAGVLDLAQARQRLQEPDERRIGKKRGGSC